MWSDPITGRRRPTLTGVSFTRGGYHRIASSVPHGTGGYEVHRPDHWLLAGTGPAPRRPARRRRRRRRLRVRRLRADDRRRPARPGPHGFDVVATAPATPFDEHTTPLPLAPGGRYELEFHAERLGVDPESLRHGHAVLGCRAGRRRRRHRRHRRLHRLGLRPRRPRRRPRDPQHPPCPERPEPGRVSTLGDPSTPVDSRTTRRDPGG